MSALAVDPPSEEPTMIACPSHAGFFRRKPRGARCFRIAALALMIAIAGPGAHGFAQSPAPGTSAAPAWTQTDRGDEFLAVDCLLPSQIRRLGSRMTFLAPRRAVKTTARDCEIRGGEYVAYDRADYKTALKVWLAPAEQGDAAAQAYVGEIYEKGLGVAPDYAAAAQWYRRAADKGSPRAALNLGALYERGLGVPRDPKEAASWYRRGSGLPALAFEAPPAASPDELRKLEEEIQRLRRELDTKQSEVDRAQQEAAATHQSLADRQAEARAERAEVERLRQERAQVNPADATASARLTALQRALDEGQSRLEATEREVASLQKMLAQPQTGNRPDPARAAEVARIQDQLIQAEARASLQRAGLEQLKQERDRGGPEVELVRVQVVEPELLLNTRAGGSAAPDAPVLPAILIAGRVRPPDGIKSLTINGREESVNEQGLFRTRLLIRDQRDELVRIMAVDRSDRSSTLELAAARRFPGPLAMIGAGPAVESIPRLKASLGKYHALVIGNDHYTQLRPLRTAVNDARAVASVLRTRYGFSVTLVENATRRHILAELNALRERLTDKDNLLIYYAGHGELDEQGGRGYWLPVDAQPGAPATWLSNVDLSDLLNAMAVRHLLVVADSCYAATLTQSSAGRRETSTGLNELVKTIDGLANRRARVVLTSGGIEPVADSMGSAHSAFAQVFVDVLTANQGTLLARDLFGRVQLRVHEAAQVSAISQVPEYAPIKYAGHEGGDFFFVRAGH
jgi:hypothetical protein